MKLSNERAIMLYWKGKLININECDNILYLFDTSVTENHCVTEDYKNIATKQDINNYSMLNTIYNNKYFIHINKYKELTRK